MHMSLILLALCLRKPNDISRLFSIAYAFAGNGCDIIVFHHNLPPFTARRMNWLEHPLLRDRQAKAPPKLSPLPPLTPIALRFPLSPADEDDALLNPSDFE
jgi:hypothetical protein